ncbi:FmdB family zinc ribbon protein [Comamonas flocculans]|uniref:Zinc ribbon domain-containing protein n=1 Tax=Comamonas flocculans TaxID=2597701 RepID=A0A5B8RWV5_9BURK|nr:FmdB family zinc ribbon protein [Comamonas flocculans]QEA14066.1 zinc ribbon domain-containing protein [Comamonas flocculans]
MPIYSYRCSHCGHARDVLQKMSDAPLTHCPACGQQTYAKQLTAAGFQLKGTGWYATDFSGRKSSAPAESTGGQESASAAASPAPEATKTEAPSAAPASAASTSEA